MERVSTSLLCPMYNVVSRGRRSVRKNRYVGASFMSCLTCYQAVECFQADCSTRQESRDFAGFQSRAGR